MNPQYHEENKYKAKQQTLKYTRQFFSWLNILLFSASFSFDLRTRHREQTLSLSSYRALSCAQEQENGERHVFHLSRRTQPASCGAENTKRYFLWVCISPNCKNLN